MCIPRPQIAICIYLNYLHPVPIPSTFSRRFPLGWPQDNVFAIYTSPIIHLVCPPMPPNAKALSFISLGTAIILRRNKKQRLCLLRSVSEFSVTRMRKKKKSVNKNFLCLMQTHFWYHFLGTSSKAHYDKFKF